MDLLKDFLKTMKEEQFKIIGEDFLFIRIAHLFF